MNMAAVRSAKLALRKEIKKKIAALTQEEKLRQSKTVTAKLLADNRYIQSNRISVFLSMDDEVQTEDILKNVFHTGKTCFIPRYEMGSSHMDMVLLHSLEDYANLPVTKWNIKQPLLTDPRDDALQTGGLDLILVPGLAFTTAGHRLGRGRGYYDTFLQRCIQASGTPPHKIALAFKEQILPEVPTDEKDILIDTVLYSQE